MRNELRELNELDTPDVRSRIGQPTRLSHISIDDVDRPHVHRTPAVAILVATLLVIGAALYGLWGLGASTNDVIPGSTSIAPGLETYVNPSGIPITFTYPTGWFAASVSQTSDGLTNGAAISAAISNVEDAVPSTDPGPMPDTSPPLDYVRVTIFTAYGRTTPILPDSELPLSMDNSKPAPGPENLRELDAQVAGVPLLIEVSAGPSASQADIAAADAIVASIRPTGSTVAPSATVSVPNLVGRDLAPAKSILAEVGLTVDLSKVSSANPPGTIDRQSPDAGTIVAPGDTVHLDVSVGLPGNDLGALDCPSGQQYATMLDPPFKLTPTDPSETVETLVRTHFSGIQPTDQVTTSTSEAGDNVVVSRSGAVIARAFLMPHLNEWLVSEVALCASSGVGAPSH